MQANIAEFSLVLYYLTNSQKIPISRESFTIRLNLDPRLSANPWVLNTSSSTYSSRRLRASKMCFGSQDSSDPTQQPIKITQSSEAQSDGSTPSKRKELKKRSYTDLHETHRVHQSDRANSDSKKSEPAPSAPLTRKQLRDKYNQKPNNVARFAGNNYDIF
jgi:hypothetical protein